MNHVRAWGPNGTRVVAAESYWRQPAKWNAAAQRDGVRRRVFCASLADVFEQWGGEVTDGRGRELFRDGDAWFAPGWDCFAMSESVTLDDVRRRLFTLIDATPWLDWLILTTRPENVRRMWPVRGVSGGGTTTACMGPPPIGARNVWLLTSVSDQQTADAMVPRLLECRGLVPVLGLSCEPLLGPVDLSRWLEMLDWVIVGGESGPHARPCDVSWIRSIIQQCRDAGVPCFVKQLGSNAVEQEPSAWPNGYPHGDQSVCLTGNGYGEYRVTGLRDKKGGDWNEWSADLRIREVPCPR